MVIRSRGLHQESLVQVWDTNIGWNKIVLWCGDRTLLNPDVMLLSKTAGLARNSPGSEADQFCKMGTLHFISLAKWLPDHMQHRLAYHCSGSLIRAAYNPGLRGVTAGRRVRIQCLSESGLNYLISIIIISPRRGNGSHIELVPLQGRLNAWAKTLLVNYRGI